MVITEDEILQTELFIEIVKGISKEASITIMSAIKVVAYYYDTPYFKLRNDIKTLKPEWFVSNCLYGYLDGKPVTRSKITNSYNKIKKKLKARIRNVNINGLAYEEVAVISNRILLKYQPTIHNIFKEI